MNEEEALALRDAPVELPEWYVWPLGDLVEPPRMRGLTFESIEEGAGSRIMAEVEWSMVPRSSRPEARQYIQSFDLEDLRPA